MARFTYDEDRSRRVGPDTELRIHGVGGTSPESLLYEHHPVLVGGDEIAGFYRSSTKRDVTEAYAWGGLTARSSVRALWIVLLPFALVNIAGWMVPQGRDGNPWRRIVEVLVCMISVGSTVAMTALVSSISVDIFALQCGGQDACAGGSVWLRWLRSGVFVESPARLILIGLLPAVIAVIVLWQLSRATSKRYEARFSLSEPAGGTHLDNDLAHPTIWHEEDQVLGSGYLHLAAAFALLAAASRWAFFRIERFSIGLEGEWDGPLSLWVSGWNLVLWLSLTLLVGCVIMAGAGGKAVAYGGRLLAWLGVALLLFTVIDGARPRADIPDVYSVGRWFAGFMWSTVFPALIGLVVMLLIALAIARARSKKESSGNPATSSPIAMAGFGPAIVVSIGLIAMTSVVAGLAIATAELLGSRRPMPDQPLIRVFSDWEVVSVGLLVYLGVIVLWGTWRWLQMQSPRRRRERIDRIETRWFKKVGVDPPDLNPERTAWLARVDRMEQVRSAWIPTLDRPLWWGVVAAVVMAFVYLVDREILDGVLFLRYVFVERHPWTETLLAVATFVIVLLPGIAWLLLWRSFRDPDVRRTVGTLWDVLTFWPRSFHPFAPPPYTARAVPELVTRLQQRLIPQQANDEGKEARVVLSAHSQGSVIAVAAILQLWVRDETSDAKTDRTLDHIALVTHGSPLASLYGRFFPAYFDEGCLKDIREILTHDDQVRWRNLYRLTDPIGGRLFATDDIDREVVDPPPVFPEPGDPLPSPRGHSHYYLDPLYWKTIEDLFALLPAR